jgi:hypothetical protein
VERIARIPLADMQTFARLHDLASIPITHALFAEHSDVTDIVLKTHNVGFSELLSNPKANAVLKYFLVCLVKLTCAFR